MKKAIIFDLDGTLLNTIVDLSESVNIVLEKYNFPLHSIEEYKYFLGKGIIVLCKKAFPKDISTKQFQQYLKEVEEVYKVRQTLKTSPFDEIREMLEGLNNLGIKIAVLSNKPHEFTKTTVEHYFPNIKFEVVYGARDGFERKPSPNSALEIAKIMNLKPEELYFVGDSETDIKTGINANIQPIGVEWGYRKVSELEESGAHNIISKPSDIFKYLGGIL